MTRTKPLFALIAAAMLAGCGTARPPAATPLAAAMRPAASAAELGKDETILYVTAFAGTVTRVEPNHHPEPWLDGGLRVTFETVRRAGVPLDLGFSGELIVRVAEDDEGRALLVPGARIKGLVHYPTVNTKTRRFTNHRDRLPTITDVARWK